MFAGGERWVLQNSGALTHYASRTYLTNPSIITEYNEIEAATVSLVLDRAVSDGIHEDFEIHNYGMRRVRFSLELSLRTDFADIFEVKAKRLIRKGNVTTEWHPERSALISSYEHNEFRRSLVTRLTRSGSAANYSNGRISFLVDLEPRGWWRTCCEHKFLGGRKASKTPHRCVYMLRDAESPIEQEMSHWRKVTTSVTSSNEYVYRLFKQSVEDMAAPRLPPVGEAGNEFITPPGGPLVLTLVVRVSLILRL